LGTNSSIAIKNLLSWYEWTANKGKPAAAPAIYQNITNLLGYVASVDYLCQEKMRAALGSSMAANQRQIQPGFCLFAHLGSVVPKKAGARQDLIGIQGDLETCRKVLDLAASTATSSDMLLLFNMLSFDYDPTKRPHETASKTDELNNILLFLQDLQGPPYDIANNLNVFLMAVECFKAVFGNSAFFRELVEVARGEYLSGAGMSRKSLRRLRAQLMEKAGPLSCGEPTASSDGWSSMCETDWLKGEMQGKDACSFRAMGSVKQLEERVLFARLTKGMVYLHSHLSKPADSVELDAQTELDKGSNFMITFPTESPLLIY